MSRPETKQRPSLPPEDLPVIINVSSTHGATINATWTHRRRQYYLTSVARSVRRIASRLVHPHPHTRNRNLGAENSVPRMSFRIIRRTTGSSHASFAYRQSPPQSKTVVNSSKGIPVGNPLKVRSFQIRFGCHYPHPPAYETAAAMSICAPRTGSRRTRARRHRRLAVSPEVSWCSAATQVVSAAAQSWLQTINTDQ